MEDFDPAVQKILRKRGLWFEKKLAAGGFGVVYKGLLYVPKTSSKSDSFSSSSRGQKIPMATKVLYLNKVDLNFRKRFLTKELETLITIHHEFIVRVFEIFRANDILFIVMEFANNGDISNYLKKNGRCSETKAAKWFHQSCLALEYMHVEHKVAHRDLKLNNILLDANFNAKVTDFGFAVKAWDSNSNRATMSKTICGTQPYFTPQLMKRVPYNAYLDDSWAMGVTLYAMLTTNFPFANDPKMMLSQQTDYPAHLTRILSNTKLSKPCKALIVRMLNPDERRRMTIQETNKSDWIKRYGIRAQNSSQSNKSLSSSKKRSN